MRMPWLWAVAAIFIVSVWCPSAGASPVVPTFFHRPGLNGKDLLSVEDPLFFTAKSLEFSSAKRSFSELGFLKSNQSRVADGDYVTVSWSDVREASDSDWLAVYCPVGTSEGDYLDFLYVNVSSSWKQGYGSVQLKLFNMREDYEFRYYRTIGSEHVEVTNRLRIGVDPYEPCHGHLALGNEASEITLSWTTDCSDTTFVRYAQDPTFDDAIVINEMSRRTYSADLMCGEPANITAAIYFRNPGCTVTALLSGLQPNVFYYYEYGSRLSSNTKRARFRSPKPHTAQRLRFLAYGDMGVQYHPYYWLRPGADMIADAVSNEILSAAMDDDSFDVVCHFGDLSYAVGHAYLWEQWGWLLAKMAQYVPYMVGVGNHEYDHLHRSPSNRDVSNATGTGYHPAWGNIANDSNGECGVPTFFRFSMPKTGNSLFWYTFDLQLATFVMLSTEHSLEIGSEQYVWLRGVLARADRTVQPWLIVMAHRPAYSQVSRHDADNMFSAHLRQQLDDLFLKYRVNLVLTGHMHSYQRSCPGYMGGCRPDGTAPVHVVVGTSGAQLESMVEFPADFTMAAWLNFGYCRVEANSTNLHVDFVAVQHDTHKHSIADSVDIPLWQDFS